MSLTRVANVLELVNPDQTIHAAAPPSGLRPMVFDNVTDESAALQALLDFAEDAGIAAVDVSQPGQTFKLLSPIVIPAGVQLRSDEKTLCNASGISTGAVFTVTGSNFTPIVGLRMDGGMFTPTSADLTSTYTGISVTGVGLKFEKCHLQYFGRAIDTAHSNTWSIVFEDCTAERSAIGWYADLDAASATNSGERNAWVGGAIANNVLGFQASSASQDMQLNSTSLDFNTVAGKISNAHVFMNGVHLEMNSSTGVDYCFECTVNAIVQVDGMEGVLSSGLYKMFRCDGTSAYGPWNPGFGEALWRGANIFYTNASSVSGTVKSRQQFTLPASSTTVTIDAPFPGQWCTPTAKFASSGDNIWLSSSSATAGTYTFTASASNASARTFIVDFG